MKTVKFFAKKLLRGIGYKLVRYESLAYNKRILSLYETFDYLSKIIQKNSIQGQFVECGYGYGRSFAVMSHFSTRLERKIYGFDSFSGFPSIVEFDESIRNPIQGEWAVRTLKEAQDSIKGLGLFDSEQDYELIELVFDKNTKNSITKELISLLHIDLDLYNGYKYALEIFWDQISPGGIVLFDEYNASNWPGASLAVNQFLESKNISRDKIQKVNDKYYLIKS